MSRYRKNIDVQVNKYKVDCDMYYIKNEFLSGGFYSVCDKASQKSLSRCKVWSDMPSLRSICKYWHESKSTAPALHIKLSIYLDVMGVY